MTKPSMLFDTTEHVLIAVHGREPPSDEEWEGYMQAAGSLPPTCTKTLVVTAGGGPNAKQRASINDYVSKTALTVAICTDALLVRQIGTALSWFNPRVKAFRGSDVVAALRYLEITGPEAAEVQHKVTKMRLEIEGRPSRAPR
ncbi:hypothetical protein [Sorangium sp. So ce426]|jgi:hypothetical protein|uniref:hypothetical protein n=1 Tax=unclassified Sorangium TaxID=2621164 RepID=UPI003F5B1994